jgi:hypothetical protein
LKCRLKTEIATSGDAFVGEKMGWRRSGLSDDGFFAGPWMGNLALVASLQLKQVLEEAPPVLSHLREGWIQSGFKKMALFLLSRHKQTEPLFNRPKIAEQASWLSATL